MRIAADGHLLEAVDDWCDPLPLQAVVGLDPPED